MHKYFLHLFSPTFEVDTLEKGMRVIYISLRKNHNFPTLNIGFNMLIYCKLRLT